ncbi:MAG: hypothetical protein RLP02_17920 [Coleofasciculus sp. C2-GNP5-27]
MVARIREVATQGLGNDSRIIPTDKFGYGNFSQGKDEDNLSRDTLGKPQIAVRIDRIVNPDAVNENSSFAVYDITVSLDLAYKLETALLESKRTEVETMIASDVHIVRRALSNPTNLQQTAAGADTGLASGRLHFIQAGPPSFNYEASLGTNTLTFEGKLFLDFT